LTGDYHAREQKIYKLIWRNTVESCMTDYTFSSLDAAVETNILMGGDQNRFYTFSYTCHKPIFYGWKVVQGLNLEHEVMDYLLHMRNLSEISCNRIETKVVFSSALLSHYTEARLIQSLEEKEIGRPSTFSTIIDKIKERDYVKKQNVKGECIECVEHVVSIPENKISQSVIKREFGNEKNKLIITSLGKSVCNFLISNFPRLFSYEYTKQMEDDLDDIACKKSESSAGSLEKLKRVCDECCREIRENIHKYNMENKEMEKTIIKNKEMEKSLVLSKCECILGTYGGFNIILKNGRFGNYIVWGNNGIHRKSIEKTHLQNKDFSNISLDEVIRFIENDSTIDTLDAKTNEGVIRVINDDTSIRSGKYGNYIFYKTMKMKKPKFISLKNFEKNIHTCSEADILSLL
jgi:DNA topoisomerase-1